MKEIVERLTENRQIELAKSILESNGYEVNKKIKRSRRMRESSLEDAVLSLQYVYEINRGDLYYDGFVADAERFLGVSASIIQSIGSEDDIDIRAYEEVQNKLMEDSKVIKSEGGMGCVCEFRESPKYGKFIYTDEIDSCCLYAKNLPL